MDHLDALEKGVKKGKGKGAIFFIVIVAAVLAVSVGLLVKVNEREIPRIDVLSDVAFLGKSKDIHYTVADLKSGLREVLITLEQGETKAKLVTKKFTRKGYLSKAGPDRIDETFTVDTSSLGLKEGRAELVIRAKDFSFWHLMKGNEALASWPVTIDTRPPQVSIVDSTRYIKPGGAGIVVYRVSEEVTRHGAMVNGHFSPGFPLLNRGENVYGVMIGLPFDTAAIDNLFVTVRDQAANEGKTAFGMILRRVKWKVDRIDISDGFLNKKLPELLQNTSDIPEAGPVDQYLYVNNDMRIANNAKIREICSSNSLPDRLWDGRFSRLPRSSRRAGFADHRSYYYQGRKIDHQVHLGIDLASVRNAEVSAANSGKVAFAEYLGIYGNVVILDHGQGVFSLYSHLSQIKVAVGDMVDPNSVIGLTGTSGMAGGDHLHFGMLVNGVFVNPLEWWDSHWLKLNILVFL